MADISDILTDVDGNTVTYFGDGSSVVTDPNGDVLDATAPYDMGTPDSAGRYPGDPLYYPTTAGTPLQDQVVIPTGTGPEISARVAQAAASNPHAQIVLPGNANALGIDVNGIIRQLATAGGQWLARTVNGRTVFYPQSGGTFGTLNMQKMLPFLAIGAFLLLKGK